MSRVTISMKAARALLEHLDRYGHDEKTPAGQAREALRRAMEPKRKPRKSPPYSLLSMRRSGKTATPFARPSKAQKRDRRVFTREAVVKRAMDAGGLCECGCGGPVFDDRKSPTFPECRGEMDHFWGRGKGRPPESLETCWFLRPACHLAKTRNQPDARMWLQKYVAHCARYGYAQEQARATSRLAFVETRSMLGAGVQQRHRDAAEKSIQKLEEKVKRAVDGGGE